MPTVAATACDAPGMLFCHADNDHAASASNNCGTTDATPAGILPEPQVCCVSEACASEISPRANVTCVPGTIGSAGR